MENIMEDLKKLSKKIEDSRPFFGDRNKKYFAVYTTEASEQLMNALRTYSNITICSVKQQCLPDVNAVYIMEDAITILNTKTGGVPEWKNHIKFYR